MQPAELCRIVETLSRSSSDSRDLRALAMSFGYDAKPQEQQQQDSLSVGRHGDAPLRGWYGLAADGLLPVVAAPLQFYLYAVCVCVCLHAQQTLAG